jgi:hypothetical protein
MKEFLKSMYTIDYLKNDNYSLKKDQIIVAILFLAIGSGMFMIDIFVPNEQIDKYIYKYVGIFIFSAGVAFLPRIWYSYSKQKNVFIEVLCHITTTIALLAVSPLAILFLLSRKAGLITVSKHFISFVVGLFVAFVIGLFTYVILNRFINSQNFINQIGILLLMAFIAFKVATQTLLKVTFIIKERKLIKQAKYNNKNFEKVNEEIQQLNTDEVCLKKEFDIMIYFIIAVASACLYFINLESLFNNKFTYNELKEGTFIAISLYTAIETILDKRKTRLEFN